MRVIHHIGKMFMLFGAVGCAAALAWWLWFFHQMLGDDVKAASECFYMTTVQCEVGNFVGLFTDVPPYNPTLLWFSGAALGVGILISTLTSKPH